MSNRDDEDPPRLADGDDARLAGAMATLRADAVSPAEIARVRSALTAATGGASSGGGSSAGAGAASSVIVRGALIGVVLVGAGVVAWRLTQSDAEPAATPIPPAPINAPATRPEPTPPAEVQAVAPGTPEVAIQPEPVASARVTPRPPQEEAPLLARAKRAVARDPREALRLCRSHSEAFPDGLLAQEREVIRIDALVALGRRAEAETVARALFARWPNAAARAHVEAALERP